LSENGSSTRLIGAIAGSNEQQQRLIDSLSAPFTLYQAGFDASWEPDLWGRVARSEESAAANSEGQAALFRQVQLSITVEVARQYFQFRSVQHQCQLVQEELGVALDVERVLVAQRQGGMESRLVKTQYKSII
jgi:outer membrane protein TolC